ncbi:MAG: hypothetical protein ACE5KL_06060 [Alphaproteobacteria bacterium]
MSEQRLNMLKTEEAYRHTGDPLQATHESWKPLFGEFMEPGSSRRENLCRTTQLAAYPIAYLIMWLAMQLVQ